MAWRGLHITQPARLSLADAQIVISRDDGAVRLPVEDVAWVVIDTPRVTLSTAVIEACMNAGIVLIVTDRTHTPSGLILPFHRHYRQAEIAARQVAMSVPLKKRVWQAIVKRKIANQSAALTLCGRDASALAAMTRLVGSGDPNNVEARAARAYWRALFRDFTRERALDRRNVLLNYGYAVLRSAVARGIVASGLLPAFGVNHASATNAFNLADDLVEPFRPFIDRIVWTLTDEGRNGGGEISVAERRILAACLIEPARVGDETVNLLVASERAAESLVRAIEANSPALLLLPKLGA